MRQEKNKKRRRKQAGDSSADEVSQVRKVVFIFSFFSSYMIAGCMRWAGVSSMRLVGAASGADVSLYVVNFALSGRMLLVLVP